MSCYHNDLTMIDDDLLKFCQNVMELSQSKIKFLQDKNGSVIYASLAILEHKNTQFNFLYTYAKDPNSPYVSTGYHGNHLNIKIDRYVIAYYYDNNFLRFRFSSTLRIDQLKILYDSWLDFRKDLNLLDDKLLLKLKLNN